MSSDGSILAVGARSNDAGGTDAGQVKVFEYSSSWTQVGSDINGTTAGGFFGSSVSLSSNGSILAVGAFGVNSSTGEVKVYEENYGTWSQKGSAIAGEAIDDFFGSVSLSADGTKLAVSAGRNDGAGVDFGRAYVYQYNTDWTQLGGNIDGNAKNSISSVSLSGDGTTIATSCPNYDGTFVSQGIARVFKNDGGTWTQEGDAILGTQVAMWLGTSVSLSYDGSLLAVGAGGYDTPSENAGLIRAYQAPVAAVPMTLTFTTTTADQEVYLPMNGTVNVDVVWGDDGTNSEHFGTASDNYSHTYAAAGTYNVTITGSLTHFGRIESASNKNPALTAITSWGELGLISLERAGYKATGLTQVPTTVPSTVTDMSYMFYSSSSFNQNIGNWDVSNVTNMYIMFGEATSFDQNLAAWNVTSVTDMADMFYNATSFDQNLAAWNVTSVTDMYGMFYGVTLSTANYDALLIGWAAQAVQNNVTFGAGNSTYTAGGAAAAARTTLDDTKGWTITDGGSVAAPNTWNGSEWTNGTPAPEEDVTIGAAYTEGTNFACNNLTLNADLTIAAGTEITVNGEIDGTVGEIHIQSGSQAGYYDYTAGSLIHNTDGVSGSIQRYFSGGISTGIINKWHLMQSPIGNFTVQNVFQNDYVYSYDGSTNGWITLEWGNTFSETQGYLVHSPNNETKTFEGNINAGDFTVTAPPSGQYGLVGNPYPSPIDWALVTKTGISNTAWIWNPESNVYDSHNGTTGSGGCLSTGLIAPTQGFFVFNTAKSGAELTMTDAARRHPSAFGSKSNNNLELVRISMNAPASVSEIVVYADASNSNGLDENDSKKMFSFVEEASEIYTTVGSESISINAMQELADNSAMPLGVNIGTAGEHTISLTIENYEGTIFLEDIGTGNFVDITTESYTFSSDIGTLEDRFVLHFNLSTTAVEETQVLSNTYAANNTIFVNTDANATISVYDINGRLLQTEVSTGANQLNNFAQGIYLVKVTTDARTETLKVFVK